VRILWLGDLDKDAMWNQNFFYERKAFGKRHEVFPWGKGFAHYDPKMDAFDVDGQFGPFDMAVCSEFFLYTAPLKDLYELDCTKVAILCDNYRNGIGMRKRDWERDGVEIVIHRYNVWIDEFQAACPEVSFYHQPWAVDEDVYKPRLRKHYDVSLLGNVSGHLYPRREKALKLLESSEINLLRSPHPTGFRYGTTTKRVEGSKIGREYAKLLSDAKLGIATGGKPDFAVGKYFTIPGSGSALLATWCDDLEGLGFEPGINMIPLDVDHAAEQIKDLLEDPDYLQEVADYGLQLIRDRHTWDKRVEEFTFWYHQLVGKEETPGSA